MIVKLYNTKSMRIMVLTMLISSMTACGGGGGTTTTPVAPNPPQPVIGSITGIVNLGPVDNGTVTVTDLVTGTVIGTGTTATNGTGQFNVPLTATTVNPVIISVTGGTFLDEYTGLNSPPLPTAGVTACLPALPTLNPATPNVAVTPLTDIATIAANRAIAAGSATPLSTIVDNANVRVGNALLGVGVNPTTTIPSNISQPPAGTTVAQQNYARVLAGFAVVAAGNFTAATTSLTDALFDPYGAPAATGGTLPAAVANLANEATNYTAPANTALIQPANVPAADPYAVINTLAAQVVGQTYYMLQTSMDPYTTTGQISQSFTRMSSSTVNTNGTIAGSDFLAVNNGILGTPLPPQATNQTYSITASNQLLLSFAPGYGTFTFSRDGEFGIAEMIDMYANREVMPNFLVKKPATPPTLASVAGTYHIIIMGHDSSMAPTAMPGDTQVGTVAFDGVGGVVQNITSSTVTPGTGAVVASPGVFPTTYSIDLATGAVLTPNGHFLFSANGQYALYETHTAGRQEWGIAIKDHTSAIPFANMTNALMFDTHAQGTNLGLDFHKALNLVQLTPDPGLADVVMQPLKIFAPFQLPSIMCGVTTFPACAASASSLIFNPVAPNVARTAVNGQFTVNDVLTANPVVAPGAQTMPGYISQNGDVFWFQDALGSAIVIGVIR